MIGEIRMKKETILKTLKVVKSKMKNGIIIDDEMCFGSSEIVFFDKLPEEGAEAVTKGHLKIGKLLYPELEGAKTVEGQLKECVDLKSWKTGAVHHKASNRLDLSSDNFEGINEQGYAVNKAKLRMAYNFLGGIDTFEVLTTPQKVVSVRCSNGKGQHVLISPVKCK